MASFDKIRYHAASQRTRPIQGHRGDHIFEMSRCQFLDQVGYTLRFHLEYAGRITFREQFPRFRIIERNGIDIEVDAAVGLDELDRIPDDGQCTQAEKVHFQQAQFFYEVFIILGRQIMFFGKLDRHIVIDRSGRNDHPCCVGRRVAWQTFEDFPVGNELMHLFVFFVFTAEFLAFIEGFIESNAQLGRHHFDDAVHFTERHVHDPPHIAQDRTGSQGTKSDNLGYMILPIFLRDVIDDLAAVFVAEVHINIRHSDPFRIEESFEKKMVFERIQPSNPQQICYDGTGSRTTAGTDGNVMVSGEFDIVPDD